MKGGMNMPRYTFCFLCLLVGASVVVGATGGHLWTKSQVTPVILVKPGIGGFDPIDGVSIGNKWRKNDVRPVVLVKPGIGGFRPREGSSIGNTWKKEDVIPVMLVEPTTGGFAPLRLLSDTPVVPTVPIDPTEQVDDELRDLERRVAEAVARFAPAGDGPDLIESRVDGTFEGWEGDTIFKLEYGQIWQQVTFRYTYTYKFRPKVWIIKTHGAYRMKVEGVSDTIFVRRLK